MGMGPASRVSSRWGIESAAERAMRRGMGSIEGSMVGIVRESLSRVSDVCRDKERLRR